MALPDVHFTIIYDTLRVTFSYRTNSSCIIEVRMKCATCEIYFVVRVLSTIYLTRFNFKIDIEICSPKLDKFDLILTD